jgi:hypothetical protein
MNPFYGESFLSFWLLISWLVVGAIAILFRRLPTPLLQVDIIYSPKLYLDTFYLTYIKVIINWFIRQ